MTVLCMELSNTDKIHTGFTYSGLYTNIRPYLGPLFPGDTYQRQTENKPVMTTYSV